MRRLFSLSLLLFILSAALFVVYEYRTITKRDSGGPAIHMEKEFVTASVKDDESVLLSDVTAQDRRDGDVTASIVVENVSTFIRKGVRLVSYAAFDRDQHVTKAVRELRYTDYKSPEYGIAEPLCFDMGQTSLPLRIQLWDQIDGDLSNGIKLLSEEGLNVNMPGLYNATLQASNSCGDVVELPVVIEIRGGGARGPQIELINYAVYLDPGQVYDPRVSIKDVIIANRTYEVVPGAGNYGRSDIDPSEKIVVGYDQIDVETDLDPNTPGNYVVNISMSVNNGNAEVLTGTARQFVVVRDPADAVSAEDEAGQTEEGKAAEGEAAAEQAEASGQEGGEA